jgi:glycerophosphoryl diester phosphodiesterase
MSKLQFIAHRGASYDAPENTISAIKLAFEQYADGVEIDVRMTLDGHLVVMHDETAYRVSGKAWRIARRNLEDLKKLDVGKIKGTRWADERIPSLEEVLQVLPRGKRLFIEFKCGQEAIVLLKQILEKYGRTEDVAVVSFDLQTLRQSKREMPECTAYWIHDAGRLDEYIKNWIVKKCSKVGIDGFMFSAEAVNRELVEFVHEANLELYTWTVNSAKLVNNLKRWQVDGVITDRPGWLREQMRLSITM